MNSLDVQYMFVKYYLETFEREPDFSDIQTITYFNIYKAGIEDLVAEIERHKK